MNRRRAVLLLGLLGGLVGAGSVAQGIGAVGGDPAYADRAWLAGIALALAVLAAEGGIVAQRHPIPGAVLMLGGGLLGYGATLLWYINTIYCLGVPIWLLGALLALLPGPAPDPP